MNSNIKLYLNGVDKNSRFVSLSCAKSASDNQSSGNQLFKLSVEGATTNPSIWFYRERKFRIREERRKIRFEAEKQKRAAIAADLGSFLRSKN